MAYINVAQINLHHCKGASALLHKKLADGVIDIALVQEPWIHNGRVLGLGASGFKIIYDTTADRPRACIAVRSSLNAVVLATYLNGDNVAVKITQDGITFVLLSAYLPFEDKDPLSACAKSLIDHYNCNTKLIIGCDANAHHTTWGSSNCNPRGNELFEYILLYDMYILNKGNDPTFITANRREVIDITLCNGQCYDHIENWYVSDEVTLSDHKLILFSIKGLKAVLTTSGRNPRNARWSTYKKTLALQVCAINGEMNSSTDIDIVLDKLINAILLSYNDCCPISSSKASRRVPWWSKDLSSLRRNCRRLFNKAKKNNDWQAYKCALTSYNKAIRAAKRSSWQNYCGSTVGSSATASLIKLLNKDKNTYLNCIKMPNGKFSESGSEALTEMFGSHFPGSLIVNGAENLSPPHLPLSGNKSSWDLARRIFTHSRIAWAINSFKPYKSPGLDGIFPIFLKEGMFVLIPFLCRIFRACLVMGYVPSCWRHTRVIFIPKACRDNYFEAKSFRPICLSSFLLKTFEKLIDRHIRDTTLISNPLSVEQHAYQPGKSTITALYELAFLLEKSICNKEHALAVFLDIEGAFDKVPVDTIRSSLIKKGVDVLVCNWIISLLSCRYITATLLGVTLTALVLVGCPQGGVLSPLLWCLVVDILLDKLRGIGVRCISYADDIAIVARGKFYATISGFIAAALGIIETWCGNTGLSVNPSKTALVAFPSAKFFSSCTFSFFGQGLFCTNIVKFLGVYFDSLLSWRRHFDYCLNKARKAFWACRSAVGRTWGLSPRAVHWIYTMIIRPIISYGSIVWWSRTSLSSAKTDLARFQRAVCLTITGCLRTTPTATLDLLLDLLPLHLYLEAEAIICRKRLMNLGYWKKYSQYLSWGDLNPKALDHPLSRMPSDFMLAKFTFDKPFNVLFPSREDWKKPPTYSDLCSVWYTDGSKGCNTGAGVYCPQDDINFSYPLGKFATVFQAEVYAILMCCRLCLDSNLQNRHILICSDSRAALLALQKSVICSCLVWDCFVLLCSLSSMNRVTLYWVPGHSGIPGNERADLLARHGSNTTYCGPEPSLGIAQNCYRHTVYSIFKQSQYLNWRSSVNQRQAKELNSGHPGNRCKELLQLSRTSLRRAIGLLTGHCTLNRHLNIMRVVDDPMCRGCHFKEETAIHILCECEYFSAHRFEFIGRHLLDPWELHDVPVKCLLLFASATGLF